MKPDRLRQMRRVAAMGRDVDPSWLDDAADEIERLQDALYDVMCGASDDPDDYGVVLDHQRGYATVKDEPRA